MATWRTFATKAPAERYALACHLVILRRRAAEGDGTLLDVTTLTREQFAAEWADDLDVVRARLSRMTADELRAVRERVARLPLLGRRRGAVRVDGGWTLRWAEPRPTADGRWAVECPVFDAGGSAAPVWPSGPLG